MTTANILIVCLALVISIGIIAAATFFMVVGRAAFSSTHAASARSFGLLFLAMPAVLTITLIIVATAVLTAYRYLDPSACIAIFSSVASFVLGAETQKRRGERRIEEIEILPEADRLPQ
jgi:peptidoglycan biosynthesis protein MviN/MurJ (putative lipid II flippase)